MRLHLALRVSACRIARRAAEADGEPKMVSFARADAVVDQLADLVRCHTAVGAVTRRLDRPAVDQSLWPEFVQYGDLSRHEADRFTDWEPVEPRDVVTCLALAAAR